MNNLITDIHLDQFERDGFMLLRNVLTDEQNLKISNFVQLRKETGEWHKAQIGKGNSMTRNEEQRGDFIQWLNQDDSINDLKPYWSLVNEIQTILNRNFYFGLNFFEAHMACYPSGSFYKRHRDRHISGSTRKISMVYYLNPIWNKSFGGLLNIFDDTETKATIEPFIGHCIVFLSELEHEVTISDRDRYSITGWFHQKEI